MKEIAAFVSPFKLDEVQDRLRQVGVEGMTVYEVKGFGRSTGASEEYRGSLAAMELVPQVRIQIFVKDALVAQVVDTFARVGRTGGINGGKLFVTAVEGAVRIRTGEEDDDAL